MADVKRGWVNCPSWSDQYHAYHGRNVLFVMEGLSARVYFTEGPVESMLMHRAALSLGWKKATSEPAEASATRYQFSPWYRYLWCFLVHRKWTILVGIGVARCRVCGREYDRDID